MSENTNTAVALYQGVEVQQAAYMAAFSQPDGMTDIIRQICEQAQSQAAEIGADMEKASDRKKLASIAYAVAKAKTAIDGTGKDLVAEAKAKIKVVDNNRKQVRDELDALRDRIRQPVTEWEDAEKAKQAEIDRLIDEMEAAAQSSENGERLTAAELQQRLESIRQYGEHENDAVRSKATDSIKFLQDAVAAAEQHEAQQAEIARLQAEQQAREQAERDARIAAEAAERAKAEAEAKARAEQEAAQQAKWEAEQKAAQAERDKQAALERIEHEKTAAAEAERQRIEAEARAKAEAEAARAADIEHRRSINRAVYAVMLECGIAEAAAQAFLLRLQNNNVPHLKIQY